MGTQGSFFAWKKFCRKLFLKGGGYVYIFEAFSFVSNLLRGLAHSQTPIIQLEHDSNKKLPFI